MLKLIAQILKVNMGDVVEARHGQKHLNTYFSAQSQARRIQALFRNFFSILRHSNFTACFGCEGFASGFNNGLQALSASVLLLSHQVTYTQTRIALAKLCISPMSPAKKNLGTFYFATTSLWLILLLLELLATSMFFYEFKSNKRYIIAYYFE